MWRKTLAGLESALALAALAGSIQLAAGIATPPDSDLPPGLSSWALPAAWHFATVAVPSGAPAPRRDASEGSRITIRRRYTVGDGLGRAARPSYPSGGAQSG